MSLLSPQSQYTGKPSGSTFETLRTIVIVFLLAFLVRSFIAQPFVVQGHSMEPSFHNADYLVVDKVSYRLDHPQRGDVIVFKAPEDPTQNYIKRVIGLPGETVTIKDNLVYVNGKQLTENYTLEKDTSDNPENPNFFLEQKLGDSEYFVMGDNRNHSSDSRRWGPLPQQNIIGRVLIVVFPFSDFGDIRAPALNIH